MRTWTLVEFDFDRIAQAVRGLLLNLPRRVDDIDALTDEIIAVVKEHASAVA